MGIKASFNLRLVNTGDSCTPIFDNRALDQALDNAYPSLSLTMEIEVEGRLPFLGTTIIREQNTIHTVP